MAHTTVETSRTKQENKYQVNITIRSYQEGDHELHVTVVSGLVWSGCHVIAPYPHKKRIERYKQQDDVH